MTPTSLSSGWRDDTPPEICALQHNSLYDVYSSSLIFCHFFKGLSYPFKSPFRRTYFNLEDALTFLPFSAFSHKISVFHHLRSANSVRTTFTCSWCILARDSRCHWPCIPSCFFLLGQLSEPLCLKSITGKYPTFLVCTGLLPAFSIACHDAPSFPRLPSTANSSEAPGPLPSNFRCNTADTN